MSRFRFRAWDTENSCWYEPTHEAYKGNLWELVIGFGGDLSAHTMTGLEHESVWKDRYKLMQSTLLKDKNGVEIYEGDILKSPNKVITQNYVKYDKDKAGFFVHAYNIMAGHAFRKSLSGSAKLREVIGNIYENPELIPKPKDEGGK